jgi:tetratricopeptide (TPR) repeat protein
MSPAAVPAAPRPSPWIFNPALDLFVGCGAWSLPLLVVTYWLGTRETVYVSVAFYFLGVLCNQPHYMATVYRAYRTPGDFRKYRFFTLYVTVFIGLTVLVVHQAPAVFPWLLTFYLTWSPWHYTGQNYGIAMMLARRAGVQPTEQERRLIKWSYVASYAVWFLSLHNTGTAGQQSLIILPIPLPWADTARVLLLAGYLGAGVYGHARLVRAAGFRAMAAPLTLFVSQFLWFLLPEILRRTTRLELPPSYSAAGILAFMHCAQYLWITTYYARREAEAEPAAADPAPRFRFGHYYLVLVLGGIALFLPGPWLASRVFGHDFIESFFIFTALVNLHHFILDGAIWRLRDGRIARLLLGRNPPADEPHHPEASDSSHLGWLFGPAPAARCLRYGLGAALLALALLDQTQFWLTLQNSGQPAFALAQLINPQDTRVYYQRAEALLAAGKPIEAADELRRDLAINPRNVPAQRLLGELLYRSGDTAAALAHYDRMIELLPPDSAVLVNSGLLAGQRGDMTKARERFEAALRLAPDDPRLHLYLAKVFEQKLNLPRAIAEYELYAALHHDDFETPTVLPTYLTVGLKLGNLYRVCQDRDRAAAWFRRVAELARQHGRTDLASLAEDNLRELGAAP